MGRLGEGDPAGTETLFGTAAASGLGDAASHRTDMFGSHVRSFSFVLCFLIRDATARRLRQGCGVVRMKQCRERNCCRKHGMRLRRLFPARALRAVHTPSPMTRRERSLPQRTSYDGQGGNH